MTTPLPNISAGDLALDDAAATLELALALSIDGLDVAALARCAELLDLDRITATEVATSPAVERRGGRIRLADPLAAQRVEQGLDAPTRCAWHLLLAGAIADTALNPSVGARDRAHHLAQAGESTQAHALFIQAADLFESSGDLAECSRCLDAALALDIEFAPDAALALAERAARGASDIGRDDAADKWRRLSGLRAAAGDVEGQARALYFLSWAAGEDDASVSWLEQAAALGSGKVGWATRAAALLCIHRLQFRDSIELDRVALRIARGTGDQRLEALALLGISVSCSLVGEMEMALQTQRQSVQLSLALGDRRSTVIGHINLISMLLDDLQPQCALEECDALMGWLGRSGLVGWKPEVLGYRSTALAHLGRMAEAHASAADAASQVDDTVHPMSVAFVLLQRVSVLMATGFGTMAEITEVMEQAVASAGTRAAALFTAELNFVRAMAAIADGEFTRACEITASIDCSDDEPMRARIALLLARAGALHHRAGLTAAAGELMSGVDRVDRLPAMAAREVAAVLCALDTGDVDELLAVAAEWRVLGHRTSAAHALLSAGAILARARDERAARCLRDVHAELVATGCLAQLDVVTGMLTGLVELEGGDGIQQLTESQLFAGLTERERALVDQVVASSRHDAGKVFFAPDQPAGSVYFLRSGRVRLYCTTADGKRLTVELLDPGAVFGEAAALGRETGGLIAEADEPVVVGSLPAERLRELIARVPRIGMNLLELVSSRLARSHDLTEQVAFWTVDRRILQRLLELDERYGHPTLDGARIINRVFTHHQLAELVNARRETVGEFLKQLRAEGLIEQRKRRIVLLDIDALRARLA